MYKKERTLWRFSGLFTTLLLMFFTACSTSPPFVAIQSEPSNHAWWLRATFHPDTSDLRGIPARSMNAAWCKFTEFSNNALPKIEDVQQGPFGINNGYANYSVAGPQVDGQPTQLVLGIYETCDGIVGTAAVLIKTAAGLPPEFVAALKLSNPARWATIHAVALGKYEVWLCFACDNITTLIWNEMQRTIELVAPDNESEN